MSFYQAFFFKGGGEILLQRNFAKEQQLQSIFLTSPDFSLRHWIYILSPFTYANMCLVKEWEEKERSGKESKKVHLNSTRASPTVPVVRTAMCMTWEKRNSSSQSFSVPNCQ